MAGEEAVEGNNKRKFSSSTSLLPWTSTPLCPRQASLCPGQAQLCCTGRTSRDATAVRESQFGLKLKRWTKMMRPLSDVLVTSSLPATQPIVPHNTNLTSATETTHSPTLALSPKLSQAKKPSLFSSSHILDAVIHLISSTLYKSTFLFMTTLYQLDYFLA